MPSSHIRVPCAGKKRGGMIDDSQIDAVWNLSHKSACCEGGLGSGHDQMMPNLGEPDDPTPFSPPGHVHCRQLCQNYHVQRSFQGKPRRLRYCVSILNLFQGYCHRTEAVLQNSIMGPTGSGKTNVSVFVVPSTSDSQVKDDQFINKLTGNAEKQKASNLRSSTQNVTPYHISYQDVRLVLVDTPGFDDTYRQDTEILRVIADWLTQKYVKF